MASRKRRCLTSEEILELVFESDEDDDCDDPEFTMDIQSSDSDSDNDAEASDSEEPLDSSVPVAPPPSKAPRLDAWQWEDDDSADKVAKIPFAGTPGVKRTVQIAVGDSPTALSMFNALIGEDFWQMLARYTNAYALEKQASSPDPSWFPTTPGEMKAYFALCILMSQVKKSSIQAYWSQRSVISTPFFASVMPRQRFWALSRYLHLCDNSLPVDEDKLRKLRPVLDYVLKVFGESYSPGEGLAVDESLMKFRGRLSYIQFNPSKRARFGIKFYKLCESSSGYCLNFSIYTGKSERTPATAGMLCSEAVVIDLVGDRLGNGHTIYTDNWYSSPLLFLHIKEAGSNAVGTVRVHRKNMPQELKKIKLQKGDCRSLFSRGLMAVTWQDKKPVTLLSTSHDATNLTDTGKQRKDNQPILKPQVVLDYNRGMGGVDREDQQLASFPIMRRYAKGYKKIFFYVMDIAVYNSYILCGKTTGKRSSYTDWKVDLAEQIVEETVLPGYKRRGKPSVSASPMSLEGCEWAHFPRQIPANATKPNPSRRCHVCKVQGKRSESRWECEKCEVALHMPVCFKLFHTRKSF
ncbi:piggyBac transposable element-derived protein 4 [Ixodes scapularis]|uniref:piggyBac transposable element-derived protein 4 n=1 Tax=Ixodes scapularis TaxID=6945 RepID=UPI001C38C8D1|nr:piggyBac transposable element-derived protein 4 [Ixodes scapularis]